MRNEFAPKIAEILQSRKEAESIRTLRLRFVSEMNQKKFEFKPGQFIEASVFGIGEAPFSICSSPTEADWFEISVKAVGWVTNALCRLKKGNKIGIRGPYGKGFPLDFDSESIVLVAGGIGLAPLRPLIKLLLRKKECWLLYGAKTPKQLLYKEEFDKWSKLMKVFLIVEKPTNEWKGDVGVVTDLFDKLAIDPFDSVGIQCGPPIMMKFVIKAFIKLGFPANRLWLSAERLMQCGIGKCGHCSIGSKYVCQDGPVFRWDEVKGLSESIW